MIKLIEVSQTVMFDTGKSTRFTTISIPWSGLLVVAFLGPSIVNGFRTRKTIAPVTNLFSVPNEKDNPSLKEPE